MVKFDHIEVEILQEGSAVPEYEDPASETIPQTVTRYIAIKEGQLFAIRLSVGQEHVFKLSSSIGIAVKIDGEHVGAGVSHLDDTAEDDSEDVRLLDGFWNVIEGRKVFQNLRFEEAELRQMQPEETLDKLREQFEDQGTICIEVSECEGYVWATKDHDNQKERATVVVPKNVAKEKGSTSRASFITAEEREYSGFMVYEEQTIAKFRFKYRTIEALHDQEIVPRPEKDIATLRAELEAIQHERDEWKQRFKQEEAEKLAGVPKEKKKRKILQNLEPGEIELIEERPAQRRKPNADDVVIVLDD